MDVTGLQDIMPVGPVVVAPSPLVAPSSQRLLPARTELQKGDALVDTCCPQSFDGQLWHQEFREHLRLCGRRHLLCHRVQEHFQFGTGPWILATSRWRYPVCVAGVETHIDIFELSGTSRNCWNYLRSLASMH